MLYEHQEFQVSQVLPNAPNGTTVDIPNVAYTAITPSVFVAYPVTPKIAINGSAGVQIVTSAGSGAFEIDNANEYGKSSKLGYEFAAGAEYLITSRVFARAALRVEWVDLKFVSDPATMANSRGSDTTMQTVFGAKDLYWGGAVTIGYLY